jgi:hypothetical protein
LTIEELTPEQRLAAADRRMRLAADRSEMSRLFGSSAAFAVTPELIRPQLTSIDVVKAPIPVSAPAAAPPSSKFQLGDRVWVLNFLKDLSGTTTIVQVGIIDEVQDADVEVYGVMVGGTHVRIHPNLLVKAIPDGTMVKVHLPAKGLPQSGARYDAIGKVVKSREGLASPMYWVAFEDERWKENNWYAFHYELTPVESTPVAAETAPAVGSKFKPGDTVAVGLLSGIVVKWHADHGKYEIDVSRTCKGHPGLFGLERYGYPEGLLILVPPPTLEEAGKTQWWKDNVITTLIPCATGARIPPCLSCQAFHQKYIEACKGLPRDKWPK